MRSLLLSASLVVLVAVIGVTSGGRVMPGAGQALSAVAPASAPRAPALDPFRGSIDVTPRDFRADPTVTLDYDIVYVRAPRKGDDEATRWGEIAHPANMERGADLMLLHPDGTEEELVDGGDGAVTDPSVSFDGEWVLYSLVRDLPGRGRPSSARITADIYKIHVPTRRVVRLTEQSTAGSAPAVLNMGPCPLPGGRIAFVSSRNGFRFARNSTQTLQLFTMDGDGGSVEFIGALNIGMALHPVVLTNGRIMFSSLESQGLRRAILWGLSSINPDGTHWEPVISPFDRSNAFHFQTQISDGSIVAEQYYNLNNNGFGAYYKVPLQAPDNYPAFGPAYRSDPRNPPLRFGRYDTGQPRLVRLGFSPVGVESLTPFAENDEGLAGLSVLRDPQSPRVGKFTHPSGAPDNHLLTVWSPGPVNQQAGLQKPAVDGGLYLIKSGRPIDEPGQMRLIKNDPRFNEQWPRALVPYRRIYGVNQPAHIPALANDGRLTAALPEGTPFGLVGASSLYKRETYPDGFVPPGGVTAGFAGGSDPTGYEGLDPFNSSENFVSLNWQTQGADAGRYNSDDIHAVRILALEPTKDRPGRPLYVNHATERMRILGEIPVRKFVGGGQALDPDGNPDTSFLAKIPADLPFTFQTLDRDGMVLNMAQTWHQVRPGEVRTDCGGCHAHSQKPTPFSATRAGNPDYVVRDLTEQVPLITTKAHDQSRTKWDSGDRTGLRYEPGPKNVEYTRDIKPIFERSCQACHSKNMAQPAAGLVLDDDTPFRGFPGTYYRLAMDSKAAFGPKPIIRGGAWRGTNASRYIRKFQSRRSLLAWKIFGRRTDGWTNDDFPTEAVPGDPTTLRWHGQPLANTRENLDRADLDYTGSSMPPPDAVTGKYVGQDGNRIKVEPLSAEDRLTIVRWIDLGCPIDLAYNPLRPEVPGDGWMGDDQPPTLTVAYPQRDSRSALSRILVGMHDHGTGLDIASFKVVADFPVDGIPPGENLATRFQTAAAGTWQFRLRQPVTGINRGRLSVSIKDHRGNVAVIDRTVSAVDRPR